MWATTVGVRRPVDSGLITRARSFDVSLAPTVESLQMWILCCICRGEIGDVPDLAAWIQPTPEEFEAALAVGSRLPIGWAHPGCADDADRLRADDEHPA